MLLRRRLILISGVVSTGRRGGHGGHLGSAGVSHEELVVLTGRVTISPVWIAIADRPVAIVVCIIARCRLLSVRVGVLSLAGGGNGGIVVAVAVAVVRHDGGSSRALEALESTNVAVVGTRRWVWVGRVVDDEAAASQAS